ncbi:hypothetical protein vBEcoPHC25922_1 [Escherichia phage vB_EcoP_HC-25922]
MNGYMLITRVHGGVQIVVRLRIVNGWIDYREYGVALT